MNALIEGIILAGKVGGVIAKNIYNLEENKKNGTFGRKIRKQLHGTHTR